MAYGISSTRAASTSGPAAALKTVAPSDLALLPDGVCRGLHVAGGGMLMVADKHGNVVTIASASGQYHPICVAQVYATGTTATQIVALY